MTFQLTPVTGSRLVGRRAELGRLVGDLSDRRSRVGVPLAGVRRVGKTSLLLEAKRRLEARGVVVVYVSAWRPAIDRLDAFTEYSPERKFLTLLRASIRRRCSKKGVKNMRS